MSKQRVVKAVQESARMILGAGFVLVFTVPMVRIYINSGANSLDLPSMPIALAALVAEHVGIIWPLFAPAVGALGAFIAGSNTVSNLMFSLFQYGVAVGLGLSRSLVVALQSVGATAGNRTDLDHTITWLPNCPAFRDHLEE